MERARRVWINICRNNIGKDDYNESRYASEMMRPVTHTKEGGRGGLGRARKVRTHDGLLEACNPVWEEVLRARVQLRAAHPEYTLMTFAEFKDGTEKKTEFVGEVSDPVESDEKDDSDTEDETDRRFGKNAQ